MVMAADLDQMHHGESYKTKKFFDVVIKISFFVFQQIKPNTLLFVLKSDKIRTYNSKSIWLISLTRAGCE